MQNKYSRQFGYSGELAKKKRRVFLLRLSGIFFIVLIIILGFIYLILFSPYIKIKDISIIGNQAVLSEDLYSEVEKVRNRKILGILDVHQNYLFFDTEEVRNNIIIRFPVIRSVDIKKPAYNSFVFEITERKPIGTWCFSASDWEICKFFDEEGGLWGETAKSQGSVLLSVIDEEGEVPNNNRLDEEVFLTFKNLTYNLTGTTRPLSIIFMANGLGDIKVNTAAGFYILFNKRGIEDQIRDLKIFLTDKESDPTFKPEYLDLRVSGRVYFK